MLLMKGQKVELVATAKNSTAPISLPLPPFRTTLSEKLSFDAKLGPCHVLLMGNHVSRKKLRQRSDNADGRVNENWKKVSAKALQRPVSGLV